MTPGGQTTASGPSEPLRSAPPVTWPAFVWTATLLALSAGFLLGGAIFLARAIGARSTDWQTAAAQAHGHIQIFGWGGLMVLGIGLHFLPRLLSVPLVRPGWPRHVLLLMSMGLVLRVLAQPGLTNGTPHALRLAAATGLALSASLELVAGAMVSVLIGALLWNRRGSPKRAPSTGVVMLIGTAFLSFQIAVVLNWAGATQSSLSLRPLIASGLDDAVIAFGLVGFLSAASLAMSSRLFPLYVQTGLPRERWLRVAATLLIAGLAFRAAGALSDSRTLDASGQIVQALAFVCGTVGLRVFEPRRDLPRRRVRILTDPLQLHVVSAYVWLIVAGCFSLLAGASHFGLAPYAVPRDAERHALGAGFVTVLILGVGSEMLPGLARVRLRWPRVRWVTLLSANLAALARVVPLVAHGVSSVWTAAIMSGAGAFGAVAIALFLLNIPLKIRASRPGNLANPTPH